VEAAERESEVVREKLKEVTQELNRSLAYNRRLVEETAKLTDLEQR